MQDQGQDQEILIDTRLPENAEIAVFYMGNRYNGKAKMIIFISRRIEEGRDGEHAPVRRDPAQVGGGHRPGGQYRHHYHINLCRLFQRNKVSQENSKENAQQHAEVHQLHIQFTHHGQQEQDR